MDEERLARLRARTFRWSEGDDTRGYFAAEVRGARVSWMAWSHVHGEGRRDLGEQSRAELEQRGPPLSVPPRVLAQILEALE